MAGEAVRVTIRVHPGASRVRVGGVRAGWGQQSVLDVWVTARAVDGKATEAALGSLADALGVRRRSLLVVSGARARVKIVEVADPPADFHELLASLSA